MVKFDLKDEHFMQLSAAGAAAYAGQMILSPRKAQDFWMTTLEPKSDPMTRWFGSALAYNSVLMYVGSQSNDSTNKKNMLKAGGACWAATAANTIYNVRKKHQKEDRGWAGAAVQAGIAGLMLWKGFQNGDK